MRGPLVFYRVVLSFAVIRLNLRLYGPLNYRQTDSHASNGNKRV
jgi:hypothetical protein